jgi:hypothetical protein
MDECECFRYRFKRGHHKDLTKRFEFCKLDNKAWNYAELRANESESKPSTKSLYRTTKLNPIPEAPWVSGGFAFEPLFSGGFSILGHESYLNSKVNSRKCK